MVRHSRRAPVAIALWILGASGAVAQAPAESPVVLVIHGGAGVLTLDEMAGVTLEDGGKLTREHYESALAGSLQAGFDAMKAGGKNPSADAVEAAIRVMEDSELFNAGRGAALNHDGQASLDASMMEGTMGDATAEGKKDARKRAGAVAAVTHVKSPISAARAVMEMPEQRAVLLIAEGAELFALSEENRKRYAIERVSNVYFWTGRRLDGIRQAIQSETSSRLKGALPGRRELRTGTVGAVAAKAGKIVAGTSTGGLTGKILGRVGDSPLPGAGTYADDRACGVSGTGTGELFIRHAVAHEVVARMIHGKASVADAARATIDQLPDEDGGVGGLIALDRDGHAAFAMSARSVGMYRGQVTAAGEIQVALFRDEAPRRMTRVDGKWKASEP